MSLPRAIRDRILSRPAVLAAHAMTLVVLSRLLTPAEFGLFALAAVAHQTAVALADLGINTQLMNSSVLEPKRHGEAFGLALVSASFVSAGFLGLALLLPDTWVPPSLDVTLWIFAACILLSPLALLFNIPLMQGMRFGVISVVNVIGAWTRCGVAIITALYGMGPAALAAGLLAEQVVSFTLFASISRRDSLPVPSFTGWSSLISDGARLSGNQMVRHLSELAILGAISTLLGVTTLGVYNRADQVVKLFDKVFLNSLTPVTLPAFVQAIKNKHPPAKIYLKKIELLSAVIWPAFAMIALLADPLCRVVLGSGWDAAPAIVQLLALIGLSKPLTQMNQALLIALGELRLSIRLDVLHHVTLVLFATSGAFISIEAVCLALASANVCAAILQTHAFARKLGFAKGQFLRIGARSLLLTACTVGPAALTLHLMQGGSALIDILIASGVGAVGFALALWLMHHMLFVEFQNLLRQMR